MYIGYLTTNLINRKIYIGIHKTEDPYKFDGYLGCGVWANHPSSYAKPSTPFQFAVKKYGPKNFIRRVIKIFETEQEAKDFEVFIVDQEFITRPDTYNSALGGGYPMPNNKKTIYQYSLTGAFIKQFDSIADAARVYKCSESLIGQAIFNGTPALKFLWTDYQEQQLIVENFKIDRNKKTVYVYNVEGDFINQFTSIASAAEFCNVSIEYCSNACAGKYTIHQQFYVSFEKFDKFPVPRSLTTKNTTIYQYDLSGQFVKEWTSYKEIKKVFGKNIGIWSAMRLGGTAGGYQWSIEKVHSMKNYTVSPQHPAKRKVGKYDLENNLVQTFNSVREAKKDTSGAPQVLRGNRKTAGGYVWKYIDDTKDIV